MRCCLQHPITSDRVDITDRTSLMPTLAEKNAAVAVLTAIRDGLTEEIDRAKTGELRDDLIEYNKTTNGKTMPVKLPGFDKPVGKVTLNESFGGISVEVVNPTAYAEWLQVEYGAGAADWVLTINSTFQKAHLAALVEGANVETEEVVDIARAKDNDGVAPRVPGVRAVKHTSAPTHLTVSVGKDDKKAIFELFKSKSVLELLPAPADTTPAAADPKVIEGELAVPDKLVVWDAKKLKETKRPQLREECDRLGIDNVGGVDGLRTRIAAKQAELAAAAQ